MKKDPVVVINFVLDNSGSMHSRKDETIIAVNQYIDDRKKESRGDVLFMLTTFSDPNAFKLIREGMAENIEAISVDSYNADGGSTALLDAVGKGINDTTNRVNAMGTKPSVLFVVLTDGEENSSKEFGKNQIFNLIEEKKKEGNWTFVFLGADASAWSVGASMGVQNSAQYDPNDLKRTLRSMSSSTSAYYAKAVNTFDSSGKAISSCNFFNNEDGLSVKKPEDNLTS